MSDFTIDNDRYGDDEHSITGASTFAGREHTAKVRRFFRQQDAMARQEWRDLRSDADQLRILRAKGHGNCAEADRLRRNR